MMKAALTLMALGALMASPALSAPTLPEASLQAASNAAGLAALDPERVALARSFVDLLYPVATREQDTVEQIRLAYAPALEAIEKPTIRAGLRKEIERGMVDIIPIVNRYLPALWEAYAQAYAGEFSAGELREMIAFASTPTGQHFMKDLNFADRHAAVTDVTYEMSEELAPIYEDLQTRICKRRTEMRVAAGETDAKCSRA